MKPVLAIVFGLLACSSMGLRAEEKAGDEAAAAKAAIVQKARELITWHDEEQTRPYLIPEQVFGLLPLNELPIPKEDQGHIGAWIIRIRDWRSPTGQRSVECNYPSGLYGERPTAPHKQVTIEQIVARGPVSLLVSVDRTTTVWRRHGIYQHNEVSLLEVLVGADFRYQDPLATRAFLSEGGEITIEGTRLCTISPWHTSQPRKGETYLLVGAPDSRGFFDTHFYFRIEDGNVMPAGYSVLSNNAAPLPLDQILKHLAGSRGAE